MKHKGNIVLALLLALIAITADGRSVEKALCKSDETQISAVCTETEFVLLRCSQMPDIASEAKGSVDVHPPCSPCILPRPFYHGVTARRSNTSFMSGKNCVCVPLRL